MSEPAFVIRGRVEGDTSPLRRELQDIERNAILHMKVTGGQPLGRLTSKVTEFDKSLEAANARVVAFGASAAVISGVSLALKSMVSNAISVEAKLTDINTLLGLGSRSLNKFSADLFEVAKDTGQSFDVVSESAKEFSRQGLNVEDTLQRTKDAMILVRLSGLSAAEATSTLTASIHAFERAGLTSTAIVNKMATVDANFAVSTKDLAEALSRAGNSVEDAGNSFEEFIALVTTAQERTARGGAVIGNALKSIFNREGRAKTMEQLEGLGIAVKDIAGNALPAITILSNLANTYDTLSDSSKNNVAQMVGGVYQMNILKALMADLSKANSTYAKAKDIAGRSDDAAIRRNKELNTTLAATVNAAQANFTKISAAAGKLTFEPVIRNVLGLFNAIGGAGGEDKGLTVGEAFGKGLLTGIDNVVGKLGTGALKGLGNILSGPGLVGLAAIGIKLTTQFAQFSTQAITGLLGVNKESRKMLATEDAVATLLRSNRQLMEAMINPMTTRTQKEQEFLRALALEQMATKELIVLKERLAAVSINAGMYQTQFKPGWQGKMKPGVIKAGGHVPIEEVGGAAVAHEVSEAQKAGYHIAPSDVRAMRAKINGRLSTVVYNQREKVIDNFMGTGEPAIIPPNRTLSDMVAHAPRGFVPNAANQKALSRAGSFFEEIGLPKSTVDNFKFRRSRDKSDIGEYRSDGSMNVFFDNILKKVKEDWGKGRYRAGYANEQAAIDSVMGNVILHEGFHGAFAQNPDAARAYFSKKGITLPADAKKFLEKHYGRAGAKGYAGREEEEMMAIHLPQQWGYASAARGRLTLPYGSAEYSIKGTQAKINHVLSPEEGRGNLGKIYDALFSTFRAKGVKKVSGDLAANLRASPRSNSSADKLTAMFPQISRARRAVMSELHAGGQVFRIKGKSYEEDLGMQAYDILNAVNVPGGLEGVKMHSYLARGRVPVVHAAAGDGPWGNLMGKSKNELRSIAMQVGVDFESESFSRASAKQAANLILGSPEYREEVRRRMRGAPRTGKYVAPRTEEQRLMDWRQKNALRAAKVESLHEQMWRDRDAAYEARAFEQRRGAVIGEGGITRVYGSESLIGTSPTPTVTTSEYLKARGEAREKVTGDNNAHIEHQSRLAREKRELTTSRIANAAMVAGFAIPMVGGIASSFVDQRTARGQIKAAGINQLTTGIGTGAMAGAMIGSVVPGIGTAIGAGVGLAVGGGIGAYQWISANSRGETGAMANERFKEAREKRGRLLGATARVADIMSQIEAARDSGDVQAMTRLYADLNTSMAGVTDPSVRIKMLAAKDSKSAGDVVAQSARREQRLQGLEDAKTGFRAFRDKFGRSDAIFGKTPDLNSAAVRTALKDLAQNIVDSKKPLSEFRQEIKNQFGNDPQITNMLKQYVEEVKRAKGASEALTKSHLELAQQTVNFKRVISSLSVEASMRRRLSEISSTNRYDIDKMDVSRAAQLHAPYLSQTAQANIEYQNAIDAIKEDAAVKYSALAGKGRDAAMGIFVKDGTPAGFDLASRAVDASPAQLIGLLEKAKSIAEGKEGKQEDVDLLEKIRAELVEIGATESSALKLAERSNQWNQAAIRQSIITKSVGDYTPSIFGEAAAAGIVNDNNNRKWRKYGVQTPTGGVSIINPVAQARAGAGSAAALARLDEGINAADIAADAAANARDMELKNRGFFDDPANEARRAAAEQRAARVKWNESVARKSGVLSSSLDEYIGPNNNSGPLGKEMLLTYEQKDALRAAAISPYGTNKNGRTNLDESLAALTQAIQDAERKSKAGEGGWTGADVKMKISELKELKQVFSDEAQLGRKEREGAGWAGAEAFPRHGGTAMTNAALDKQRRGVDSDREGFKGMIQESKNIADAVRSSGSVLAALQEATNASLAAVITANNVPKAEVNLTSAIEARKAAERKFRDSGKGVDSPEGAAWVSRDYDLGMDITKAQLRLKAAREAADKAENARLLSEENVARVNIQQQINTGDVTSAISGLSTLAAHRAQLGKFMEKSGGKFDGEEQAAMKRQLDTIQQLADSLSKLLPVLQAKTIAGEIRNALNGEVRVVLPDSTVKVGNEAQIGQAIKEWFDARMAEILAAKEGKIPTVPLTTVGP